MEDLDPAGPPSGPASKGHRADSDTQTVGYRRPPVRHQFKKKQSANAKGRPPGSKNRKTIVRQIASETHRVTENGRPRCRSTLELVLLTLRNLALGGNVRAFRCSNEIMARYDAQATGSDCGYLIVPAVMSVEEAIREGEKANAEALARHAAQSRK